MENRSSTLTTFFFLPMVVLVVGGVSYDRGTPVGPSHMENRSSTLTTFFFFLRRCSSSSSPPSPPCGAFSCK